MKKLNLIKRLLSYSHEKQSPQRFARYAAMLIMLLTLGVGQMWAYNIIRNAELAGGSGDWSNSDDMTQVGSSNVYYKTYSSPKATTDLCFRIGSSGWTTAQNASGIDNLNSNITMLSNGDGDSNIKFQVPTSVPVTIYYNSSTNKIWIKVDSYKTDVLNGKEMFYYGFTKNWSGDFAHFYDNSTRKFGSWAATSYADGSAKLAIGVYDVSSSTNYSASNSDTYAGVNHLGMAGGDQIQTYTDGSNKCYHNAADQFSFGTTAKTIVVGQTIASFPTISFTSEQSGADADLSLEGYYYSTATSGETWTAFTPGTTESSLAAGTYYIKAIATDGAIYMASTNYITLTVNSAPVLGVANASSVTSSSATFNATVTLNSNTTSSYGFKYGAGASYDTKAELISGGTTASTSGALDASTFSKNVTGLSASTTYYYISYVVVNETTYYSDAVKSFTTSAAATYNLSVEAGTGISAVTGSTNNISASQNIAITATVATGYTWNTWTKTGTGTLSTFTAGTKNQTVTVGTAGDITLTASATENMSTLSTSCSYDAGDPEYSDPTVSGSATTVGYTTTRTITAPDAGTGYVFAGWTLTNCTRTDGGGATANPITIRSNGDGAAATVVANYTEVLTTGWKIVGQSTTDKANSPFSSWTYASSTQTMSKATGHSTESVVYATVTVAAASVITTDDYYEFKVTGDGSTLYGYGMNGDDNITFDQTKTNQSVYSNSNSDHALRFKPDVAGNYTFKVDYSGTYPQVSVTFPTSYTLTYGIGSVAGTDGSISTSPTTASGSKVLSGNTVTLTGPAAKTGYSWKGWYTNEAGTEGKIPDTDRAISVTMDADKTLYACYTENINTVTVNASSGGKVSYNGGVAGSSCSASAGVATASATISAIPDEGYAFVDWTNVDADHHITNYTATWNSTNNGWDLTVNADDATTITANFEPRFALKGSIKADGDPQGGMPGWGDVAVFSYSDGTYTLSRTLTSPNTCYKFQIIDRLTGGAWIWRGYTSSTNNLAVDNSTTYTLSGANDVYFDSRGVGSYTFTVVEEKIDDVIYPKVKIQDGANSHVVTWGYVSDNGQEGGTITSVVDGEATPNNIASGKYVKDGGSITATAEANDGYRFIDFRTSSTYGGGDQLSTDNPYTVASVTADQNIYAQFAENLCTVTITTADASKGSITVGGVDFDWGSTTQVGVYNYKSLVVNPAAGYYFSGWTLSDTPDFTVGATGESGSSTNLTGLGGTHGSTGTLTANFVELDKIYFRNVNAGTGEALWDSVYVGFDPNYWGTGTDCSGGPCGADVKGKTAYKMDKIGDTNIWWAYVPRAFTSASKTGIVFFNKGALISHDHFYQGKAAYRADYKRQLDMFIPNRTKKQTYNETDYYDNGYWGVYHLVAEEEVGYYLKNSAGDVDLDQFQATTTGGNTFEATHYINSLSNQYFRISSAGGVPYDANEVTITSSNAETGVVLRDNDAAFTLTPTSEGNYIFRLSQESDALKLTVLYPISPGDYRLKHTYTGRNKANSADSTYITYSDIIKANVAGTSTTYSMYLNDGGTETLVLQKCTSIDGETKQPVWSAGDETNLSGVLSKLGTDGNGVYQFDITVNTSTDKVSEVANIKLYDGPFYIKTDCAPGQWLVYTANPMNKNTANPTAFDYYFISWIDVDADKSETKNIKCVIANDYNNAVSDTLKGDGIATIAAGEPVLDQDGSVRFSYNSKTNTLKRTYLYGASSLKLIPKAEGYIYNDKGDLVDQYSVKPAFVDDVLWTYEITVRAKLGAQAAVKAEWTNKATTTFNDTLVAKTNTIIGGTGSGTYVIRIIFDFKTNTITSTWEPSGDITEALSNVDVMLVREGQNASDVITFDGGSLEPRKLVGALKFTKTTYWGNVGSWTSTTRPLLTFFVSFPFDVKVSDIFGLNSAYGDAYVIRRYAGDERAEKGFFRGDGTTTFWKDLTVDSVMHANIGYLVVLDNDYFNNDTYSLWGEKDELYLYFPSSKGGTIADETAKIEVPSHLCELPHSWTEDDGEGGTRTLYHSKTDSHWNLIGVPVFTTVTGNSATEGSIANVLDGSGDFHYFYEWNSSSNDFSVGTAHGYSFKAMHSYMVQYHGDITFSGSAFTPAAIAARRAPITENYKMELQVLNNDAEMLNRTYIELRDEADDDFVLNEDVYLSPNNRDVEIYSFAGDYDVAANVRSVKNQTVQLGLNVHKAGTYSITMPSGFSGTATLIDTYNNTRTNLAIEDYEVNLTKGACNDRFLLEININKAPTAIDGVSGDGSLKDGKAHKFIENGVMYILQNGRIYNAEGALVK